MRYYRVKKRYGEHAAALLAFATGMGVIALALAVWVLGAEWGLNNPGSKAVATLIFGGFIAFALWRPDIQWYADVSDNQDDYEMPVDGMMRDGHVFNDGFMH